MEEKTINSEHHQNNEVIHKSDCALHNEPYMKNEPCDCGALDNQSQVSQ